MFKFEPGDYEEAVGCLEASGNYRVLRRVPRLPRMPARMMGLRRGIFLGVETTGLDPAVDGIIQIAMVPFAYDDDGRILGAGTAFARCRNPGMPIPAKVTQMTGIDNDTVAFEYIDPREVEALASHPDVVVAHNAAIDRRFMERFSPSFKLVAWACSMSQVTWEAEGHEGTKLSALLMGAGMFHDAHDAHRAVEHCHAALALLSLPLPVSGKGAFASLLDTAFTPTLRFWAVGAPFEMKETLKARGYRWSNGDHGTPRCWYRDVPESGRAAEIAFLAEQICFAGVDPTIIEIDACARFSDRG